MSSTDKPSSRLREIASALTPKLTQKNQISLNLSLAEASKVGPLLASDVSSKHLWLGIYLSALPLEAIIKTPTPAAVFESENGARKLLLANKQAAESGITPGLTVNAALALIPSLLIQERNLVRENQVLNELAEWAEKFTSFICIEQPSLLLLEIAGSLKLFGGVSLLRQQIVNELEDKGLSTHIAIAPTPLAATWLARAGHKVCIRDPRNLVSKLRAVPLHALHWPSTVCTTLNEMGVETVGEILRLPREGFTRRFGKICLLELDRAVGKYPDPRTRYQSNERFSIDFDLEGEQEAAASLLNICWELLLQLEKFLLQRQLSVQQIDLTFFFFRKPFKKIELGILQADNIAQRWFDLLKIKFENLDLDAPVIAIRLCSGYGQEFTTVTDDLKLSLRQKKYQDISIDNLVERLSARIGSDSVYGVMTVDEHRPQCAWQPRLLSERMIDHSSRLIYQENNHVPRFLTELKHAHNLVIKRPLWILREPQPLSIDNGMPIYKGVLDFITGPERIETGWWDHDGISRDYFMAVNPAGVCLWIYQNCGGKGSGDWYLHGKFG
ncbi:MAG: hypothetical protein CMO98_01340 [Woeseia sp.]|nr:hypothetical protein [Woeseia sp.]